jgi:hypothetical protein
MLPNVSPASLVNKSNGITIMDPLVAEGVAVALSFPTLRALPTAPIFRFVSSQGTLLLVVFTGLIIPINVYMSPPLSAFLATTSNPPDMNWYPDTGFTNHLTHNLSNINLQA